MQYKKGKHIIEIAKPPKREKFALFVGENNSVTLVATFRNNECADILEKKLGYFLGLEGK